MLRDGRDVTIIANGIMVSRAARGGRPARAAGHRGARPQHGDRSARSTGRRSSTRPRETGAIVTVEEHTVRGGLGGAVAEVVVTSSTRCRCASSGSRACSRRPGRPSSCSTTSGSRPTASAAAARASSRRGARRDAGLILAIDQGTTNTKAIARRRAGGGSWPTGSVPAAARLPRAGLGRERRGGRSGQSVQAAARALPGQASDAPPIAAIGIANQRESVLVWDRATGEPLGPCISWQCRRTADTAMTSGSRATSRSSARGPASGSTRCSPRPRLAGCSTAIEDGARPGPARRAVHRHRRQLDRLEPDGRPDVRDGPDQRVADAAPRPRPGSLGRRTCSTLFGIPTRRCPRCGGSSGHVSARRAAIGPIPGGIPIAAMVGDSHAALFGHGAPAPGTVKVDLWHRHVGHDPARAASSGATACPRRSRGPSSDATAGAAPSMVHALEGNITATGATLAWLDDAPRPQGRGASSSRRSPASVPDPDGVYLVPAFAGLGAPHWDPDARGLICGLTRGTSPAHVALAGFESIAYQVRDVIEVLRASAPSVPSMLIADGGAMQSDLLAQIQADVVRLPGPALEVRQRRRARARHTSPASPWERGTPSTTSGGLPRAFDRFEPGDGAAGSGNAATAAGPRRSRGPGTVPIGPRRPVTTPSVRTRIRTSSSRRRCRRATNGVERA